MALSQTHKWAGGFTSRGTVLTTELNSISVGARSNLGTEIDNATNLDDVAKVRIAVDFVSAPAAGGFFTLYRLEALDGSVYPDGSSSVDPGNHQIATFIPVTATTAAQVLDSGEFQLFPGKTKFLLSNNTSQALPASGTTVTLLTANRGSYT